LNFQLTISTFPGLLAFLLLLRLSIRKSTPFRISPSRRKPYWFTSKGAPRPKKLSAQVPYFIPNSEGEGYRILIPNLKPFDKSIEDFSISVMSQFAFKISGEKENLEENCSRNGLIIDYV